MFWKNLIANSNTSQMWGLIDIQIKKYRGTLLFLRNKIAGLIDFTLKK